MLVYIGFPSEEQETLEGSAASIGVQQQTSFFESVDPILEVAKDFRALPEADLPTVVFLNIDDGDWKAALNTLKAHKVLNRLPVVCLGRIAEQASIDEMYDLGVNSYIRKPDTFREIVEVMIVCQKYWLECTHLPTPYLADL